MKIGKGYLYISYKNLKKEKRKKKKTRRKTSPKSA
jgi:hypothetical protein